MKRTLLILVREFPVMAVGLCIGCPNLVGRLKAGNSNMQKFFATHCTFTYLTILPAIAWLVLNIICEMGASGVSWRITNPLRLFRRHVQKLLPPFLPFWPGPIFLGQARRVMAAQRREIRKEAGKGKPMVWT